MFTTLWDMYFVYLLSKSALHCDVYKKIKIIQTSICFNFSVHFHCFIVTVSAQIVWFYILIWTSVVKVQFSLPFQFHWAHPSYIKWFTAHQSPIDLDKLHNLLKFAAILSWSKIPSLTKFLLKCCNSCFFLIIGQMNGC